MNVTSWLRLAYGLFMAVLYTLDPWGPMWFVSLNLGIAGFLLCTVVVDWLER